VSAGRFGSVVEEHGDGLVPPVNSVNNIVKMEPITARTDPSQSFELIGRDVHIWSIRTEAPEAVTEAYEAVLSPDERARACQFKFPQLSQAFAVSRGVLRILLSRYLDVHPSCVQFEYGPKGKPRISAQMSLEFNTSHSGGLTLFAFTRDCPIGIDVEHIRAMPDLQDIARRFFCTAESTELAALAPARQERAFFLCWTRKEAYIKAVGQGLSAPLDGFRVSLDPTKPAQFLHLPVPKNEAWTLTNLAVDPGYAAALAYPDSQREVTESQIRDPAALLV
jgi:4'-phosphopantetheinyl transferase